MRKPLTLEIHGTGIHNRGAELMAIAIAERMRVSFPEVRLVVPPYAWSFEARARLGFYINDTEFAGKIPSKICSVFSRLVPTDFRSVAGLISSSEVDAVLDASGFAFSDQWGAGAAKSLLSKMEKPDRRNQPLILLPQAFGPFDKPEVAATCRALFSRAALVCARDDQSFSAVERLGGAVRLAKYPDFTLDVTPALLDGIRVPDKFSAIVPNFRMLDKTVSGDMYIALLKRAVSHLRESGRNPVFVLHDSHEDRQVIQSIDNLSHCPVLEHHDPRVLKGILGRAELVIGSRFHALVSSLAQGVPCIGLGWSHKYIELFNDFDTEDFLVTDLTDHLHMVRSLEELSANDCYQARSLRLRNAATRLKDEGRRMWNEVENLLRMMVPKLRRTEAEMTA